MSRALSEIRKEARSALARGDSAGAKRAVLGGLGEPIARDQEYADYVRSIVPVLTELGDRRGALSLLWFLEPPVDHPLFAHVPASDVARTWLALGTRMESAKAGSGAAVLRRAGESYERLRLFAHSAIAYERAGDLERARNHWVTLARDLQTGDDTLYAGALATWNVARTSQQLKDEPKSLEWTVKAVHGLEEAADRYERIGQRERAFDCFQVLLEIGKKSGAVEHLLEGQLNVIRILKEDGLKLYALQNYEDALSQLETRGELSAAATVAREMHEYAERMGEPSLAQFAKLTHVRLLRGVAKAASSRGLPANMAESALIAALASASDLGQLGTVEAIYDELIAGCQDVAKAARFAKAKGRFLGGKDAPLNAAPLANHQRQTGDYPDVWWVDLIEWEQRGIASEACGDILLDESFGALTRRKALVARLRALAFEEAASSGPRGELVGPLELLLTELGQLATYTLLSPLEALAAHAVPAFRAKAQATLGRLLYKRTFITLRAGLSDPDESVRAAARVSLEQMRFPHALDPAMRILEEASDPKTRRSALTAVYRIDTPDSAEALIKWLAGAEQGDRLRIQELHRETRGGAFGAAARTRLEDPTLPAELRSTLSAMLGPAGAEVLIRGGSPMG